MRSYLFALIVAICHDLTVKKHKDVLKIQAVLSLGWSGDLKSGHVRLKKNK